VSETQASGRSTGPFLAAAVFCETLLEEKNGTKSLIRVVDRITQRAMGLETPEQMAPFEWTATLFIALKPGQARGNTSYRIRMESPDGLSREIGGGSFNFLGGPNQGADLVSPVRLRFEMAGLYWFDIEIDGQLLTRMPLEVLYERRLMQPLPQP
jgi:hypothetical protein